ncbi:MAG: (2Fe-2S)-binding protein [Romboutsia sp.]|nr:(2Fe-2S)-binding protein [Romboutsia sp.]
MENNKIICFCNNVNKESILNAIKDGASTLEDVKAKTTAAAGRCCGGRCKNAINEIIEENK